MSSHLLFEKIGFSKNETKVYLALIHHGKLTVASIAQKSQVKRPTVYLALGTLGEKGLVKQAVLGKRTYFLPENPAKISKMLAQQKKQIEDTLPTLIKIYKKSSKEPEIVSYYGKDGVRQIYTDVQEQAVWAKSIFSPTSFYNIFSYSETRFFAAGFKDRDAKLFSLLPDDLNGRKLAEKNSLSARFLPKDYELSVNTIVWGDKVALISYENLFGVVINNQEIAKYFENQFDWWWKTLK